MGIKNLELKLRSATKRFAGMNFDAISNISLDFDSHKIYAVVGPNGAGKTTLIKVIADLITLDSGELVYTQDGIPKSTPPKIALALDGGKGFFSRLSVLENFRYFSSIAVKDRPAPTLDDCYKWLNDFKLTEKIHAECQSLSQGMLQRLALSIAVSTNADLILLDEPTNGLDIVESLSFFKLVRSIVESTGAMVIFCSHQPETILGLADKVSFIQKGKIIGEIHTDRLNSMTQSDFVEHYLSINNFATS